MKRRTLSNTLVLQIGNTGVAFFFTGGANALPVKQLKMT